MKNLSSRVISAIIALIVLVVTVYYGRETGVNILIFLTVARGSYEYCRMIFDSTYPSFVKGLYITLAASIFLVIAQDSFRGLAGGALIFALMLVSVIGVLLHKQFKSLEQIVSFVTKYVMGLVYTCLIPATVSWTLQTNNGMEWFFCLLIVVFAGDIGAYIFGVNFGKTKIAPDLSPNKSVQGALGGLLFSTLGAVAFSFVVLPNTPFYVFPIVGFFGGFLGQIGDFFESLLKRISGVKDSGSIMPGHGGILDRLDGVLMAAPLFYFAATHFSL
jgi:phosphatidate cytidylyltransferase